MSPAAGPGGGAGQRRATAAIVLAAGSSRRFGSTKLLATLEGRPLVAHAVRTALDTEAERVIVVTGHDGERVAAAARAEGDVCVAPNPEHRTGQASSLSTGLRALRSETEVAVVLLGDQPGIRPTVVAAVLDAVEAGAEVARARYEDGVGHPVAFTRGLWPELLRLQGDQGARALLERWDVAEVEVDGTVPADVDEPHHLHPLAGHHRAD